MILLEIRDSSIVAPIALVPPPERLILGTSDLAGLGVHIALELGFGAALETAVAQFLDDGSSSSGGVLIRLQSLGLKGGRHGGLALESLELGLFPGRQLGWAGLGGEGRGGVAARAEQSGEGGARGAGEEYP
ncbi:unnamed protein product [Clonostachys rosea]|uniref:Uncharacterized protein n=1 Tax=Bionectria ochroleuca TaxID=29856 RepID=A0ABY6UAL4_BIOOC|nr:unnamed protein product [Clonostachys rosea]